MKIKRIIIIFSVLFAIIVSVFLIARYLFPLKYEDKIEECGEKYHIEEDLLMGVIFSESGFNEEATSGKANGLMQLTDETAKWVADRLGMEYSEEMVYVPGVNIEMGSYYLAYLMENYKNTETALAAYNAGMGNVSEWLKNDEYSKDGVTLCNIPYGETKRYVERVMKIRKIYRFLY